MKRMICLNPKVCGIVGCIIVVFLRIFQQTIVYVELMID